MKKIAIEAEDGYRLSALFGKPVDTPGGTITINALMEWRSWCISKTYYMDFLKHRIQTDRFYNFTVPITAIYTSDDYIANDKTASLMMQFFPNAPCELIKLDVHKFTPTSCRSCWHLPQAL